MTHANSAATRDSSVITARSRLWFITVSQVTDEYIEDGRIHILATRTFPVTPRSSANRTLILCGAREQPAMLIHQAEFKPVLGPENICDNIQDALQRAEEVCEGVGTNLVGAEV